MRTYVELIEDVAISLSQVLLLANKWYLFGETQNFDFLSSCLGWQNDEFDNDVLRFRACKMRHLFWDILLWNGIVNFNCVRIVVITRQTFSAIYFSIACELNGMRLFLIVNDERGRPNEYGTILIRFNRWFHLLYYVCSCNIRHKNNVLRLQRVSNLFVYSSMLVYNIFARDRIGYRKFGFFFSIARNVSVPSILSMLQ